MSAPGRKTLYTGRSKAMARCLSDPVKIAQDHFLLTLNAPEMKNSSPGQFVNIRVSGCSDPLVRRPFSIFFHENHRVEIIVKTVGRGTRAITGFRAGDSIDMLGPLGRGFTPITRGRALLAGGGVGNAPLYYLSRRLTEAGIPCTYLYCCRSSAHLYLRENFEAAADSFIVATDDGSCGERGRAPEIAERLLKGDRFDIVYTCGPTPMMEGVARAATGAGVPVEVSLENYFGCGIGLCSGCTVETEKGNKRACVDGPVMDGSIINWHSFTA
ncbi:MAG TPA: dihydroorotate dehydrogenase electron transfer subunit [Spirochaetes bacterium]|nr:dihydroorotate dehydrogenase electron transfer subunit [Spirochaetota bacterium]